MTIQEKKWLEELMQQKLADALTVNQMATVIGALWDACAEMEVLEQNTGQDGADSEYLKLFIQAKRIEGRTEKTIARYDYLIRRFLKEVNVPATSVTTMHLRKWYASELERGISLNTVRGYNWCLGPFFEWLWKEGLIRSDPCANIGTIKVPKLKKEPFTSVELELMKEHCTTSRDKAIVCFLLATGCRIEETVQLNREDINFQNKEIVVFGKGSKERTVYLDDVASAMLFRYFADRKDESAALFSGKGSERMTAGGIRTALKRLEARCGVENIHPHRFRRTLATNLARKGMSIQEIAAILGHEKVTTTMGYVSVDADQVKSHYQAYVA